MQSPEAMVQRSEAMGRSGELLIRSGTMVDELRGPIVLTPASVVHLPHAGGAKRNAAGPAAPREIGPATWARSPDPLRGRCGAQSRWSTDTDARSDKRARLSIGRIVWGTPWFR